MSSLRILTGRVDTLEVSYGNGVLSESAQEVLDEMKVSAQNGEPQVITLGGIELVVRDKGRNNHRWVAENEELSVAITASEHIPTILIGASALSLAHYGPDAILEMMERVASEFDTDPARVSRIDIAIDFQGWVPDEGVRHRIICPAQKRDVHGSANEDETYSFGKYPTMMRLYNKTRQAYAKKKEWVFDTWEGCDGFDPDEDVWRWEIELHRSTLKRLQVETPQDALDSLPNLVGFGLKWAELRIPKGKSSDRWERDPIWDQLATSEYSGEPLVGLKAKKYLADYNRLLPMLAGLIVSAGATLGIYDFEQLMRILSAEVPEYYRSKGESFAVRARTRRLERLFG